MFRKEKLQLKKRKNAALKVLLLSAFVTFMCFSMLVGTTYAWLTDSVTSANNRIVSGSLDIRMNYYAGDQDGFVSAEGDVFESVTWQPGAETHRLIQIYNNSDMPIKFAFKANVMTEYGSINTEGSSFLLSDSLVSYQQVFANEKLDDAKAALSEVVQACKNTALNRFSAFTLINDNNEVVEPGESKYVLLALYMPESGVEASTVKEGMPLPSFEVELDLAAIQASGAQDSFGSVPGAAEVPTASVNTAKVTYQLDANALLYEKKDDQNNNYYEIKDAADFARFAAAVNNGYNFSGKTVKLTCEEYIDLAGADWPLTGEFAGAFDGNGKKIKNFAVTVSSNEAYAILFNGTCTVSNLTAEDVSVTVTNGTDSTVSSVAVTNGTILVNP